jgi:hypothetical protein
MRSRKRSLSLGHELGHHYHMDPTSHRNDSTGPVREQRLQTDNLGSISLDGLADGLAVLYFVEYQSLWEMRSHGYLHPLHPVGDSYANVT